MGDTLSPTTTEAATRAHYDTARPETEQAEITKLTPERERFSVPHAARDPKILEDRTLENEDIFEFI